VHRFSTDRLAAHFLLILRGALAPQSAASFKSHHGATAAAPFGTLSESPSACGARALKVGAVFQLSFYPLASCARFPSLPQGPRSHPQQILLTLSFYASFSGLLSGRHRGLVDSAG
jgi:hypothetical protein